MNQQVVYLLAIGRFYPQGANNENTNEQSQTSLAMQSLLSGTLSGQINSILKNVIKSNDWSFGANISTGNEGWNNAEYEGLISGRLFNNRLLINGQFGYRDNATTANPSLRHPLPALPQRQPCFESLQPDQRPLLYQVESEHPRYWSDYQERLQRLA